jgi:transcriptional regulator with XRE-family HTH domain
MDIIVAAPSMKNLESRIKNYLSEKGMTIQRLASESGISEPTIHAIFNRGDAKLSQLEKIAEALSVELTFLVSDLPENSIFQNGDSNQAGNGNSQKVTGNNSPSISGNHSSIKLTIDDCKQQLLLAQRDVEHLRDQLARADALVESKEQTINLLRARFDRPN